MRGQRGAVGGAQMVSAAPNLWVTAGYILSRLQVCHCWRSVTSKPFSWGCPEHRDGKKTVGPESRELSSAFYNMPPTGPLILTGFPHADVTTGRVAVASKGT